MNLKGKHFLSLLDFSPKEITQLLELASQLKKEKYDGSEQQRLKGKQIALIFEKDSTRTRCAIEVAAKSQGAHTTYLGSQGNQIGVKESIKDTARVLSGMYDAILYRGYGQDRINTLAQNANIPVYNGLTNEFHPTQALADLLTLQEHFQKPFNQIKWAYIGDASNNVAASLLVASAKLGVNFSMISPHNLRPNINLQEHCLTLAKESGSQLLFTEDKATGLSDCDAVYTDVWLSMGEDINLWEERISLLLPYQVNNETMALTNKPESIFMHCLPAFHNLNTEVAKTVYEAFNLSEMEVTDEVFESDNSVVFQQAENRIHTLKALLVASLK